MEFGISITGRAWIQIVQIAPGKIWDRHLAIAEVFLAIPIHSQILFTTKDRNWIDDSRIIGVKLKALDLDPFTSLEELGIPA